MKETCKTCDHWDAESYQKHCDAKDRWIKERDELNTLSGGRTIPFTIWAQKMSEDPGTPTGDCRRFPQIVKKAPGDYCGEHRTTPKNNEPEGSE